MEALRLCANTALMATPRWWLWLVVSCVVSATVSLTLTPVMGLFHDDAIYASTAKTLAQSEGYRLTNLPSNPTQTKYPPFYAICLAATWWTLPDFPDNVLALKGLNILFLGTALLAIAALAERHSGVRSTALPVLCQLALGTSPAMVGFANYTMTEVLFTALVTLILLLWGRGDGMVCRRNEAAILAATALATLTRSVGIAITVALMADALIHRQWKRALLHATWGFGILTAWMVWARLNREPSFVLLSYYTEYERPAFTYILTDPRLAWSIVSGNLRLFWDTFFFTAGPGWMLFWPVLVLVGGIGLCQMVRLGWRLPLLFSGCYLAFVVMHPFTPQRYALPLLPVFVLAVVVGAFKAWELLSRSERSGHPVGSAVPIGALVIMVLLGNALGLARALQPIAEVRGWHGGGMGYEWEGFEETFDWIRQNTPEDAILGGIFDPMYYMYTGRRAVRPWLHRPETYFYPYGSPSPNVGKPEQVLAALQSVGVGYLVLDPPAGYAEGAAAIRMLETLLQLPAAKGRLLFTSQDGLHRVYSLQTSHKPFASQAGN